MSQESQSSPGVVVAIPCFNTEATIGDVVSKARKYAEKVVVVDDGSLDSTASLAKAAGAEVIAHGANRGYGEAINSCFKAARDNGADILVILDGDGQHEPAEIPRLLAPILNGEADLVIGSRFLDEAATMPGHRKFGISVITWLFNLGSRTKVSDTQSGFRAYNRRIFGCGSLSEKGMSASIEILEKARRRGAVIKEVPVSCLYTISRLDSRATKQGLGVALSVIRIRLRKPGE